LGKPLLFSCVQHTIAANEIKTMRNWRSRFTPFQQRIYDRSASIASIQFVPPSPLLEATQALQHALTADDHPRVEALAQTIVNHICWQLSVRTVWVQVQGVRPSNRRGELHGLYTHYGSANRTNSIQVWMRTAKRGQVVAFRTFLRTLLHEVCHHLDYAYFHLRESYHTEGFFQRESSLFHAIVRQTEPQREEQKPPQSLSAMVREVLAQQRQGNGKAGDTEREE
jgi:hypothetical protein